LEFVYVIVDVPAATPVTTPVLETVATPVLEDTHGLEAAAVADPVKVVVKPTQADNVPVIVGSALTVTIAVFIQPLEFVYVIVEVPADTPVTTPVLETVATAVLEDTQGLEAAAVADPVNVVVSPTQTDNVPVIVGNALIVTVAVAIHPVLFVYVIVDVPAATPVTTPVLETVATPVLEDTQGLEAAAVPEPVKVVVKPTQADNVPVIVGVGLTVTVAVMIQPLLLVYVIVDVPVATPVTTPVLETVATPVLEDTQGLEAAAVAEPVKAVVSPTQTDNVPVIVGSALIVTVAVVIQPFVFV
jgi:hypothetical protein